MIKEIGENLMSELEKSKVYFTDFRCEVDEGPATKLSRLIDQAGHRASLLRLGKWIHPIDRRLPGYHWRWSQGHR